MYDKFKRKVKPGDYILYLKGLNFETVGVNLLLRNMDEYLYTDIFGNIIDLKTSQYDYYDSNIYKIAISDNILNGFNKIIGNSISNSNDIQNITDCFNRDLKVGDFVVYSSYLRNELIYGIVYSSNLVYTEYGFLDEALFVYLVDNPTALEKKKKEKIVHMYNNTFSLIGQVGSVYQDIKKPVFYIDLGNVNLDFIPDSSFKYINRIDEKYSKNNHMYISLYYDSVLNKDSTMANLFFNYRLSDKGRGDMLRFLIKNRLNSFERKLDKELRKRYIVGFDNLLVNVDMAYKYPCIAKIENIENMIYDKKFNFKDYTLIFHK